MRKNLTLWVFAMFFIIPGVVAAKYAVVPKIEIVSAPKVDAAPKVIPDVLKVTKESQFMTFLGKVPVQYEPSIGMGRNVPLYVALEQISPPGWEVFYFDNTVVFENNFLVTWLGAKKWTDTLGKIMESVKGHATVNWVSKQVEIKLPEPPKVVKQAKKVKPPVSLEWLVKWSDKTVSGTLSRWAEETRNNKGNAKYTVLWESPKDCLVEAEARFSGDFRGAVRQVVEGLRGTEAPIEAVWHTNNVVRIVPMGSRIK